MKVTVGIADDHQLFVKSLSLLVNSFSDFQVVVDAANGKELLNKLALNDVQPDILLIDVNMPIMKGYEAAEKINRKYPLIKMAVLSMKEDDLTVIRMIRAGCCAYLLKDIHPDKLEAALVEIDKHGYYNSDIAGVDFWKMAKRAHRNEDVLVITEKEMRFLNLACSDLTYKQIAVTMHLAERTIDGYRESLFQKLGVQSRVGMVLEAMRRELVNLEEISH